MHYLLSYCYKTSQVSLCVLEWERGGVGGERRLCHYYMCVINSQLACMNTLRPQFTLDPCLTAVIQSGPNYHSGSLGRECIALGTTPKIVDIFLM